MAIAITCGSCRKNYRAKDELAGRKVKCPGCSATIEVPAATSGKPDSPAPADTSPGTVPRKTTTPAGKTPPATAPAKPAPAPRPAAAVAKPPQREKSAPSRQELWKQVLAGFQGEMPPRRRSPLYLVGVLFTTVIMIALPLVYVALICAVCWVVYLHMINDWGIIGAVHNARVMLFMVVVYFAPLIIGAILIVFMIKPLFAPPAQEGRRRSFTRQAEPVLFALVDKICATVNAPALKRIDINCDVNASAGFRRGWLSAMVGSDLVLTIGMPIVAGLSLEEFVGVLAHEFGHFSQGVGMRLTYVVRSIGFWFLRVCYQRDSWDVWLAQSTEGMDIRIGWVLFVAQFCVWLTRKVLWVLMMLGHLVAGFMLRQMEFDADSYETRLVGSKVFESTSRKLPLLGLAFRAAHSDAVEFYHQGRLPDSLPALMMAKIAQIPDVRAELDAMIAKTKTGLLDTHPADKNRIAAARRLAAAGVFRCALPARCVFSSFAATAQNVTYDFYREVIGKQLKPDDLHPVELLLAERGKEQGA